MIATGQARTPAVFWRLFVFASVLRALARLGGVVLNFTGPLAHEKPAAFCHGRIDHFVAAVPNLSDARPSQRELETMGGAYDSIPTTNGASPPRQKQSVLLAAVYGLVASLMCARRGAGDDDELTSVNSAVAFAAPSNWIPSTPSTRLGSPARGSLTTSTMNRIL